MIKLRNVVAISTCYGECNLYSFNGLPDRKEHLLIEFRNAIYQRTPLVRVHSECLTGDLLGSQMCDCGEQFYEAIKLLSKQGGILIYLRQEGRGIGLYNKIDAYGVQKKLGLDTFEANYYLNFPSDLRDYSIAACMLHLLGVKKIKLLTNNPEKVEQLQSCGISVVERISTGLFVNKNNKSYLISKLEKSGHLFNPELIKQAIITK